MPSGTITQPLKWPGGKNYLAQKIIDLMPPHLHYVEPYFGGGAVLLQKDSQGVSEVVNDINKKLVNFWNVIADAHIFPSFVRIVEAIPFSEDHYSRASAIYKQEIDDFPIPQVREAAYFFVACRQSRSGMMKDFATLSRNRTRAGMNEQASAWLNAVEGLPAVHARLKRVVILNRPALEVIKQQDGERTLHYVDPPYVHSTRATKDLYAHEMSYADHVALLDTLASIKGKFMLSGYHCELYDNAAKDHGWKCHDFEIDNKLAGGKTKAKEIEAVWCNY